MAPRFKSIYGRFVAVLLGLFCLIGFLYSAVTVFTTRMYFSEINQKLNRDLAKDLVAKKLSLPDGKINRESLRQVFKSWMLINPAIEIYLLDPDGVVLASSAPPENIKTEKVALEPLKNFLNGSESFPLLGDDPRKLNRQKVFSVSTIPSNAYLSTNKATVPLRGYLYVILGGEDYDTALKMIQGSYIFRLSATQVAAGLLFAFVAGLLIFKLLMNRLKNLNVAMQVFKQSEFSNFVPYPSVTRSSTDEIDQLGSTFNQMAARMLQQVEDLKKTERLRRELVANVSHDIRTPLASLQGYLETLLLKERKLTAAEEHEYLETAVKHSQTLGKLVSELFELARLDEGENSLRLESFSVAEVAQDVVREFQLIAARKKVLLQTDFQKDLPFVHADIGLIERVLQNVIENALQYTSAGGTITVKVTHDQTKVTVQVTDTGLGISKQDLPYIFDRYHRVQKEDLESSSHAGLGLAISKKIIELHGADLRVDSTPDVGTTFTFSLPATG